MHDESIQAKEWSQIFSEETIQQSIPVITAWQLNERMYNLFTPFCFFAFKNIYIYIYIYLHLKFASYNVIHFLQVWEVAGS